MKFIEPQIFWLLPAVAAAIVVLGISAARRRRKHLQLLLGSSADDPSAVRVSYSGRRWRIFFLLMAAASLITAAARPFWGSTLIPYSERGRDILVIFDVSKSMLAADPAPSRLAHARYLLRELVSGSRGDRFALVAFAGNAYLACPFTADISAFDQYVEELSPDMIPAGGTNIEVALRSAMRAFESAGGHRAVVLFSDGEELSGNSKSLLDKLREERVPIFVVGLGDPATAVPLPDENGNLRRDAAGKIITSTTNEKALAAIAAATGGEYLRSTVTDSGIETLRRRIDAIGTAEVENGKRTLPVEKFPLALIAAGIFMLLWLFTPEAPRRRRFPAAILMLAALLLTGAAENPASSGAAAAAPNDDDLAPAKLEKPEALAPPAEKLPEDPAELYNLALEKQQSGETETAARLYDRVLKDAPAPLQAKSLFNLGTMTHTGARGTIAAARQKVAAQQLDEALKELEKGGRELTAAEELYAGSLAIDGSDIADASRQNINMLTLDRKAAEELKKQIEELKKQQKKARQQAKRSQEQNKQDQQKQNQDQQNQQNRENKDKGRPPQNQQNKDSDQQSAASGTRQAQQSAEKLSSQAEKLGQKQLAQDARDAARELKKAADAQSANRRQQAQKHLDEAVKKLGADGNSGQQKKPPEQGKNQDENRRNSGDKSGDPGDQALPQNPQAQNPQAQQLEKENDRKNAAALLKMLDDEEKQLRDALRSRRRSQRPAVEKDW